MLACYGRGLARLQQQHFAAARADFDTVLQLSPDQPEALINRSLAMRGLGMLQPALRDLTRAIDNGAPQTRVYFLRAALRQRLGDSAGARTDIEHGIALRPTDELSWIARGVQQVASDPRAALADFRNALRLNPCSRPALQDVAHVCSERLGDDASAIDALSRLIAIAPDDADAFAGRGVLFARTGQRDKAIRDAECALQHVQRPLQIYQIASIWALTATAQSADINRAVNLLARALRQDATLVKFMRTDTDLDALRHNDQFQHIINAAEMLCQGVDTPSP